MGDPTIYVYQFIYDENDSNGTKILQYFIMNALGLCIKVVSYVSHMFYACSFSHNKAVPMAINKNKYFIYLNTYTTIFAWRDGNSNKNRTQQLD